MAANDPSASTRADDTPLYRLVRHRIPRGATDFDKRYPVLFLWIRICALLAIYVLVDYFFRRAGHLAGAAYEQPLLIPEVLKRIGLLPGGILAVGLVLLLRFGSLTSPWTSLEFGLQIRVLIVFLAALMAWPLATYGYNYYFDQGHYFDRALVVVLVPLIYYRPIFIYPFLLVAFPLMWQFHQPAISAGAHLAHKLQVLHVLTLFAAVFLIHAVTGNRRMQGFFFLTCCLVAAAYWVPALTKIERNWVTYGHLYRMPLAAYAHGWLAFLEPSTIVRFAKAVAWFDWPMRIFTLVVEGGCLLFLWRRSVSIALLIGVIVFHLGVFALYGYLMWTWILLDVALLIVLVRDWSACKIDIYSRHHLIISALFIGFASYWCSPSSLGWYDTRITYNYRYEVVGESGKRYTLHGRFLEPYGDPLTMSNFGYLPEDHSLLVYPYGITGNRLIAERLTETKTAEEVFALEAELGDRRHDTERAAQFYGFITRYLTNWNARGEKAVALYALHPPVQFWSSGRGEVYRGAEPIREVSIKEVTTLFDEDRLIEIRSLELAKLPIPTHGSPLKKQ